MTNKTADVVDVQFDAVAVQLYLRNATLFATFCHFWAFRMVGIQISSCKPYRFVI